MKKHNQKKAALVIAFLLSVQLVAAQKADTSVSHLSNPIYDRYMHRHKTFKTLGWVFLAPGTALVIVGLGYVTSPDARSTGSFFTKFQIGEIFIAGGGLLALPSIPFFIIAGNNKKKARMAELQLTTGTVATASKFNYAALTLKINL